ncbi:DNA polymerase III subunit epsilon [Pararoseomonas sp. SCSIO 73927]|uniref:DNA polymerase III subunit epsilon n=1 Tax=Pararoseomonas sp. SCSIO 73927 TaxID=3114537 RepID=UPI0030D4BE82
MSRALILDTETTGLDPATGDRVLEVAAIEVVNLMPTGRHFHKLINPERDVPPEATKVHGFTASMLADKPLFAAILPELLEFLGDDPVIAHNAPFDFKFLDYEFDRCETPRIPRSRMVDTLEMAKKRFPGLPNSLDALCRRFGIDLSARTTHNALLDVQLLGQVYLELMGGKQPGLALATALGGNRSGLATTAGPIARTPRPIANTPEEMERHAAFTSKLKDPVWAGLDAAS